MTASKDRKIAIQVSNVTYEYVTRDWVNVKKYTPLDNITLSVFEGETLGIKGRNGTGKSTLLKLLAGIYEPTKGHINAYGNKVTLQTLSAGFDVELSGYDNALIGAMLLGHSIKESKRHLQEIGDLAELGHQFADPVKTYSAGMRARLGFAIAITMHTNVLLIDEVLSVGDSEFLKKAEDIIANKTKTTQTVVLVSHSDELIHRLCDRVLAIEDGQIVQVQYSP
jgi:lipopolysaccharide transport system ATP-binding protein